MSNVKQKLTLDSQKQNLMIFKLVRWSTLLQIKEWVGDLFLGGQVTSRDPERVC